MQDPTHRRRQLALRRRATAQSRHERCLFTRVGAAYGDRPRRIASNAKVLDVVSVGISLLNGFIAFVRRGALLDA